MRRRRLFHMSPDPVSSNAAMQAPRAVTAPPAEEGLCAQVHGSDAYCPKGGLYLTRGSVKIGHCCQGFDCVERALFSLAIAKLIAGVSFL